MRYRNTNPGYRSKNSYRFWKRNGGRDTDEHKKKWKHVGKGGRIGKNKNKKVKGFTQRVTADGVVLQVSFY